MAEERADRSLPDLRRVLSRCGPVWDLVCIVTGALLLSSDQCRRAVAHAWAADAAATTGATCRTRDRVWGTRPAQYCHHDGLRAAVYDNGRRADGDLDLGWLTSRSLAL